MRTAKKVESGSVLRNWRDMRMSASVLPGVMTDDISLPVHETKVFGYGKVFPDSLYVWWENG